MASPSDRRYLQTHEWHKVEADHVRVGVSQFAVDELTDITYLEILRADGAIKAGESFGEIESVKATSDLYCGVDGTIVEVNQTAIDDPAIINDDPYGKGWLIKVQVSDESQWESLLSAEQYDQQCGGA